MTAIGKVEIQIHGASELKDTQTLGRQDPYCVITPMDSSQNPITDERLKTKVHVDGGRNPQWNEIAVVNLTDKHMLWVRIDIWNENSINSDSYVGRVRVPLQTVTQKSVDKMQLPVFRPSGKQKGWMTLTLRYTPAASQNIEGLDLARSPQASQQSHDVAVGYSAPPLNAMTQNLEARVENQTSTSFSEPFTPNYGAKKQVEASKEHSDGDSDSHHHGGHHYRPYYGYYRPYYGYRRFGYHGFGYPYYRPYGFRYGGLGYGLGGGLLLRRGFY